MKRAASLVAACLVLVSSNPGRAQAPNDGAPKIQSVKTTDTGWQVICRSNANERAKLICTIVHETFSAADRSRLTALEIVKSDKTRTLVVSVPLGVSLKDGIVLSIDAVGRAPAPFANCQTDQCLALIPLDDKTVDALRKAKVLGVGFSGAQGSKIKTEISLEGFAQAFAKAD